MSNFIRAGFISIKATFLIGTLIVTPVAILVARTGVTSAKPDTNVCVAATWKANAKIVSHYGNCPAGTPDSPGSSTAAPTTNPTASPTPTSTVTPTSTPTQNPEVSPTSTPSATLASDPQPSVSPTPSAAPTETQTPAPEVTPTTISTFTPAPFPTPTPTHSPDVLVSPTPVATAPVVPPAPNPIPIPVANTDPKTTEFMFCHDGAMHSNSFTGMMNGHHGKHPDDIIPPIPFKFYGGWNWNATNAKTFYNNCVPVS